MRGPLHSGVKGRAPRGQTRGRRKGYSTALICATVVQRRAKGNSWGKSKAGPVESLSRLDRKVCFGGVHRTRLDAQLEARSDFAKRPAQRAAAQFRAERERSYPDTYPSRPLVSPCSFCCNSAAAYTNAPAVSTSSNICRFNPELPRRAAQLAVEKCSSAEGS